VKSEKQLVLSFSSRLTVHVFCCLLLQPSKSICSRTPRSQCHEPMAECVWSDKTNKVFVSTMLFAIGHRSSAIGSVAPALLMTGNESILWEVAWLIRSSRRSLCR
jgi:hypothetical protein